MFTPLAGHTWIYTAFNIYPRVLEQLGRSSSVTHGRQGFFLNKKCFPVLIYSGAPFFFDAV